MQVDPGDARHAGTVLAQHAAQRAVAPGGRGAAEEQAVGELVLAARDGGLEGAEPVRGDPAVDGGLVLGIGRPVRRQQQRVQRGVVGVGGQRPAEILEVAVQVHVLVGHAPAEGKAVRVERMQVEHGHAGLVRGGAPFGVVQREHLHARAAITLDAVAGAADDEQALRESLAGGPVERGVQRQRLALHSRQRVRVRGDAQPRSGRGFEELDARRAVAGRKGVGHADHAPAPVRGVASQRSAKRTQ